jgi:hypothetical protein
VFDLKTYVAGEGWGRVSVDKRRRLGVEKPCDICLCEIGVEVTTLLKRKRK